MQIRTFKVSATDLATSTAAPSQQTSPSAGVNTKQPSWYQLFMCISLILALKVLSFY